MMDEIFDRTYQHGRDELNAGIDRAVRKIGRELLSSFNALHRVQWAAPWLGSAAKSRAARDVTCA